MNKNLFSNIVDCFFIGIFVNNNSTLYDTSSSCKDGREDNVFGNVCVLSMEYC